METQVAPMRNGEPATTDAPQPAPAGRVIVDPEGRLLCHVCGLGFLNLWAHARMHGFLNADAYREAFGLNRQQPLNGPELRAKRRAWAIENKTVERLTPLRTQPPPSVRYPERRRLQERLAMRDRALNRERVTVECPRCGQSFLVAKNRVSILTYCPNCRAERRRERAQARRAITNDSSVPTAMEGGSSSQPL